MKIRLCDIYPIIITKVILDMNGLRVETARGRTWIPGFAEPEDAIEEVGEMSTQDL